MRIRKVELQLTGCVSSFMLTQACTEGPVLAGLSSVAKTHSGTERLVCSSAGDL